MRTYLLVSVAVIVVFAFVALFYISNEHHAANSIEIKECYHSQTEQQSRLTEYKFENIRLAKDLEQLKAELKKAQDDSEKIKRETEAFHHQGNNQDLIDAQKERDIARDHANKAQEELESLRKQTEQQAHANGDQIVGQISPLFPKCWENAPLYKQGFDCGKCSVGKPKDFLLWDHQPDLCSYLSLGGCCHYRHFLGNDYDDSPQFGWGDVMMMDFAFSAHLNVKNFVEMGTFRGISSLFFGTLANLRGGQFVSFDISDHRDSRTRQAWENTSNMKFVVADLLNPNIDSRVMETLVMPNTFYFFDNGDKPKETRYFLKHIAANKSPFCTHDWGYEITINDIQAVLTENDYVPFAFAHAEMLGSHVRCFHPRGTLAGNY